MTTWTKRFSLFNAAFGLTLLLAASAAHAAITYVDAAWEGDAANTTTAEGAAVETSEDASSTDGKWRQREFGNGKILEAVGNSEGTGGAPAENVPRLKTTIGKGSEKEPFLPAGKYNVYVYFWQDEAGSPWRIEASLENPTQTTDAEAPPERATTGIDPETGNSQTKPGAMSVYGPGQPNAAPAETDTSFANTPPPTTRDEDGRTMWEARLGTVTLDGNSPLEVYIDSDSDLDGEVLTGGNERTWYDGIGYELVK